MFGHEENPTQEPRTGRHRHHRARGRSFGRGRDIPGGFRGYGPGGSGPRGRKARRGDIRTAALLLLAEEPRNGYQVMQEVEERSEGLWRPSPGSVYPALAQLEDEGLIATREEDGRKLFAITDAGREVVAERGDDQAAPWEQMSGGRGDEYRELGHLMRQVAHAFRQVMHTGSPEQIAKARDVLDGTRRDLYRILADGDTGGATVHEEK
jgi:DNA-binding PadR family transcriptional regulator